MQIARKPIVLFQIAGAMVGTFGSNNTRTMLRTGGTTEQPDPVWIQHRSVIVSFHFFFFFSLTNEDSQKEGTDQENGRKRTIIVCYVLVFDGGLFQALGANSAEERDSWLQALQLASYECMRSQLLALRQRIEAFSGHKHDTDVQMLRLQRGITTGTLARVPPPRYSC